MWDGAMRKGRKKAEARNIVHLHMNIPLFSSDELITSDCLLRDLYFECYTKHICCSKRSCFDMEKSFFFSAFPLHARRPCVCAMVNMYSRRLGLSCFLSSAYIPVIIINDTYYFRNNTPLTALRMTCQCCLQTKSWYTPIWQGRPDGFSIQQPVHRRRSQANIGYLCRNFYLRSVAGRSFSDKQWHIILLFSLWNEMRAPMFNVCEWFVLWWALSGCRYRRKTLAK